MQSTGLLIVLGVLVLLVFGGVGSFFFMKSEASANQHRAVAAQAAAEAGLAAMAADASDELSELQALRAEVAALKAGRSRESVQEGLSEERVAEIVAQLLDARGLGETASEEFNVHRTVSEVIATGEFNAGTDPDGVFAKAKEAGKLDELIGAFEQHARDNINDAQAQADYGSALIVAIQHTTNQQQKGALAMKADRAFDEALDINPEHWGARFTKAMSYSFYPAVTGMQPKAIEHFEILIGQQQGKTVEPRFSQTYQMLGNMYAQRGEAEKAKATWEKGLLRHPGDEALLKSLNR